MKKNNLFLILFLLLTQSIAAQTNQKARTIVTTDGEIDDVDSFIRMLLYSNEFDIEGLVYSSSMWHYKGDGKGTTMVSEMDMTKQIYGQRTDLRWPGVTWMQELLTQYDKVYPTLSTHAKGFPTAKHLQSLVKVGNIDFEGEMSYNTEGSDFIKSKLLDSNTSPLYLQVWGGTNTIARALKTIEEQYKNTSNWPQIYKKIGDKAIIYAIFDQDATYRKYIAVSWPNIKVYYNANQFACLAYPWKKQVPVELQPFLEGKFMSEKIINNHGPLLKMYYSYGDGQKQVGDDGHTHGDSSKIAKGQWGSFKQYDFISEGDSPAYLHLLDVGLDNLNNPQYGGWGGKLKQSKTNPNRWEDGPEVADYNPFTKKLDFAYPQTRWLEALQNDFAARADWCVKDYKSANHAPEIVVKNKNIKVKAGQMLSINATATDPDKNKVNISFWQYMEAGTLKDKVVIGHEGTKAQITIPSTAKRGDTVHIIVEGTDNGIPSLTRYQRVILTVI
jgi:Protein of unknown function (DUF1593)